MKKVIKRVPKKIIKKSSLKLKPRGVSKVIIIAVVALVLLGAGGFFIMNQNGAGSLSKAVPFIKTPLNPDCVHKDPELCKFLNNWQVQENYTVATKSTIEGMSIESLYEMSGQDKFHMVSKQDGKETSNVISIADTTYTLDYTDKKWWKYTVKPTDNNEQPTGNVQEQFDFNTTEAEDTTKYTFVVEESCGDLQCFKYEIVSPDVSDIKQYMWFDDKEYLMRKMTVEGSTGEMNESVFSYEKVSINEPSPIKDGMPENSGFGGASEAEMQKMMQEYQDQSSADNATYPEYNAETPVDENTYSEF